MADSKLEIIITAKDNASGPLGKIGSAIGNIASIAGGFLVANVIGKLATSMGDFFTSSIDEAREAIANQKELAQVIESTGGIAGVTADEANSYAEAISKVTNFTDDAVLKGENMLLTFTNIGSDVFPRATAAMVDMGAKFGNIDTASVQLGKALNDPIKGVGALSKIGVTFTEQQKEQIKAMMAVNDIAGAQGIILAEVEKQVGGLAEAVADPAIQMQNAWADAKEEVGMAVIPVLNKLSQIALPMISSALQFVIPHVEQLGIWVLALVEYFSFLAKSGDSANDWLVHLPEFLRPVIKFIGDAIIAIQDFTKYIIAVVQGGDALNDWLTHLPEFIQPIVKGFGEFVAIMRSIILHILGMDDARMQHFGWMVDIPIWLQPVLTALGNFSDWFMNIGIPVLQEWGNTFRETVVPIIQDFINNTLPLMWQKAQEIWAWITNVAIPGLQEWGNSITEYLTPKFAELKVILDRFMVEVLPLLQQAWETLATSWRDDIGPALGDLWKSLKDLFATLGFGTSKTDFWKVALALLKTSLVVVTQKVRDWTPAIKGAADTLVFMINMVKSGIDRFVKFKQGVEGIIGAINRLIGKIRDMANRLASLALPSWLRPGSPTPFELGLRGIGDAIGKLPELQNTFNVGGGGALAASPMGALGGGLGGSSIVINLTYAPAVSLADKLEAEQVLAPFIANGVRNALAGKR